MQTPECIVSLQPHCCARTVYAKKKTQNGKVQEENRKSSMRGLRVPSKRPQPTKKQNYHPHTATTRTRTSTEHHPIQEASAGCGCGRCKTSAGCCITVPCAQLFKHLTFLGMNTILHENKLLLHGMQFTAQPRCLRESWMQNKSPRTAS